LGIIAGVKVVQLRANQMEGFSWPTSTIVLNRGLCEGQILQQGSNNNRDENKQATQQIAQKVVRRTISQKQKPLLKKNARAKILATLSIHEKVYTSTTTHVTTTSSCWKKRAVIDC